LVRSSIHCTFGLFEQAMTRLRTTACAIAAFLIAGCATASRLPDPLQAGWNGHPVCERLHEDNKQRVLRCTFAPGVGHERHYHAPHFGYALSGGDVRIRDENGTREVSPPTGSSYNSDGVAWHEIMNIGSTTLTYLIIERK
tara:strand:+ start:473 stop:895 length:423 start_codon:yes stop_codon:yes gene_type:complete